LLVKEPLHALLITCTRYDCKGRAVGLRPASQGKAGNGWRPVLNAHAFAGENFVVELVLPSVHALLVCLRQPAPDWNRKGRSGD
jgi:hypothetical protein